METDSCSTMFQKCSKAIMRKRLKKPTNGSRKLSAGNLQLFDDPLNCLPVTLLPRPSRLRLKLDEDRLTVGLSSISHIVARKPSRRNSRQCITNSWNWPVLISPRMQWKLVQLLTTSWAVFALMLNLKKQPFLVSMHVARPLPDSTGRTDSVETHCPI